MKFSKWATLSLSLIGLTVLNGAQAIEVFPVVKEIREETPRDNYIIVKSMYKAKDSVEENDASKQAYEFVTLELFHVPNPGDGEEQRVKVLGLPDPNLVFSPTRLVVPFGEERKVRIMPLKPVEKEEVYRLRVRPSYPEQELDKGKVRFAIGYDVLVRYLPTGEHRQAITVSCNRQQWALTATGNVRSELRNLVVDGKKYPSQFNVYPGNSRTLTVNNTLTFELNKKLQVYEQCQHKE
ncbi:fimbrial biogenesis chaperone [Pectobacterium odoriferum]|uniref:Uncharacterized protein n=1 Tax=Pectobacterium odoriferum TaxID=78398 RepID=A0ABD6VUW9_9GAMM|nr:hypothetical protein [Pectobacterium odoriferum]AIU86956.1 hypothetical protein BCS7_01220 [Pectobacterium odoriferum]KGA32965.1 hypothetical protein KS43_15845 [Pectobacterium odoriferum]KGA41361.1 hypothetical protein KU75_11260 [Pectobacterium odoriferum]MBA0188841.1 hypothetical protein [Pectobacterium odoriferum]MCA6961217.1 hypothetical protein [Pectobacterium odoriferum]